MEEVPPNPPIIRFGTFELDLEAGELRKSGLKVKLHDQPFQILAMLLERPGRLVSREELQKRLWPTDTFVDFEHSLNAAVKKLRQALGDDADNPRFVETLPRRGYRFIHPVAAMSSSSVGGGDAAATVEAGLVPAQGRPQGAPLRVRWRLALAAAAVLAVAAIALNVAGLRDRALQAVGAVREPPLQIHSIAVLPLENLSGDPEQDYFADGMTDELITRLAQIRAVRVISRGSVMQYKGAKKATAEIARELNVDAVVEGAVLRSGDRVRISAQLIEAAGDHHLWARSYERELSNILTLQSELARAIAREIRVAVTPEEEIRLARARPLNPEAYEAYLMSRRLGWGPTPEKVKKAVEYAQQAIKQDPDFALGYAALADAYSVMGYQGFGPAAEVFPKAKQAALNALAIDDSLAEPHASLGTVKWFYEWDWSGAEKEFERALELKPRDVDIGILYGGFLQSMGRLEEGLAETKELFEQEPLSPKRNEFLALRCLGARRYDEAMEYGEKALEVDPNSSEVRSVLARAYQSKGMIGESLAVVEAWKGASQEYAELIASIRKAYETGGSGAALQLNVEWRERQWKPGVNDYSAMLIAGLHAQLNHKEKAFEWLERAYEARQTHHLIWIKTDPRFDSLHSDARYHAFLRRMNFPK